MLWSRMTIHHYL